MKLEVSTKEYLIQHLYVGMGTFCAKMLGGVINVGHYYRSYMYEDISSCEPMIVTCVENTLEEMNGTFRRWENWLPGMVIQRASAEHNVWTGAIQFCATLCIKDIRYLYGYKKTGKGTAYHVQETKVEFYKTRSAYDPWNLEAHLNLAIQAFCSVDSRKESNCDFGTYYNFSCLAIKAHNTLFRGLFQWQYCTEVLTHEVQVIKEE